jgi:tetraacyldisaccharide 4'-kinase
MIFFRHIERPVLLPFSLLYGFVVIVRNLLFDLNILKSVKLKTPVISVGNLSIGGTGKTPHIEYLAGLLHNDFKIAVLSRGYKRKSKGFTLGNKKSRVSDIGDEPLQILQKFPHIPVAVDKNRVDAIKILTETIRKLDCVLLDDAFQHRYVKSGLSILLVDFNKPVFNDVLLPAGNLREPLTGMRRADIIIVTKCASNLTPSAREDFISRLGKTVKQDLFFTRYEYGPPATVFKNKNKDREVLSYKQLKKTGVSVMLVTGIANATPLKNFIKENARVEEEISFPDHHYFSDRDIQLMRIKFDAIHSAEKYIIVTEKDAVRLKEKEIHDKYFRKAFFYIPIEVKFLAKGEKPFIKRIYKYMKKAK